MCPRGGSLTALDVGGSSAAAPVFDEELEERAEIGEAVGLFEIGVGPQGVGLLDVFLEAGATEDDGGDFAAFGVLAQPKEDVEAGELLHFQVEYEHVGHGMFVAIVKGGLSLEIINDFSAVLDHVEVDVHTVAEEGHLQQFAVGRGVLRDEHIEARFIFSECFAHGTIFA